LRQFNRCSVSRFDDCAGLCLDVTVLAEGVTSRLLDGQPGVIRVMLRDLSMHLRVLSPHFMKDLSLHASAIDRLF
jgi:hypothetical protein